MLCIEHTLQDACLDAWQMVAWLTAKLHLMLTWSSVIPSKTSMGILMIFSGYFSAKSSMLVPPAEQQVSESVAVHCASHCPHAVRAA